MSGGRTGPGAAVPPPPADLADRPLVIEALPPGTTLYRIARSRHPAALFFGPPADPSTGRRDPEYRFDDPQGRYGVCYLGLTPEAAFCETFLREPDVATVAERHARQRDLAEVAVVGEVLAVQLRDAGLARAGATAAVTDGPYPVARQWSRAVHDLPGARDGITYRARHDNGQVALALFDRARGKVAEAGRRGVMDDRDWFFGMLDRYGRGFEPDTAGA